MREFGLGKGCFSCKHRGVRIGQKVLCKRDNTMYWMYLVCTGYEPTDNQRIISYLKKMLPINVRLSTKLVRWLEENYVITKRRCPVCGSDDYNYEADYCPHCDSNI